MGSHALENSFEGSVNEAMGQFCGKDRQLL